jgi:hypothetical protein
MELLINNFTEAGNHLKYRKGWEDYQKEKCNMKTYRHLENKIHYNRIFETLTDNRSIDVLNEKSLKNVKKLSEKEYIIKYINENKDKKTPQELAEAIALAIEVPVNDQSRMREIFNMVMEELRVNPPVLSEISIAINGRDVPIIANDFGVRAGENIFFTPGVTSTEIDEETGERQMTMWAGDNQVQTESRAFGGFTIGNRFGGSGQRMFSDPGQFSAPTDLPPRIMTVAYNRQALPILNTPRNEIQTQTEGDYPSPPINMMGPGNVKEFAVSKKVGPQMESYLAQSQSRITNTAQTNELGALTTEEQRTQYTAGGYRGSETRLPSGVRVMSPIKNVPQAD